MDAQKLGDTIIEQPEARSAVEQVAREIAREEIASLSALVLRRLQEEKLTRSHERNVADDVVVERMNEIFGEALADFGGHTGSGAEPGGA